MAKSRETVDAETAARITNMLNESEIGMSPDDPFRAVIWPRSQLCKVQDLSSVVNLRDYPCQRRLIHILCLREDVLSDRVVVLTVLPTIADAGYMITLLLFMCDYDGQNMTGVEGYPLTFSDDEIVKRQMETFLAKKNRSTQFKSVEALLAQDEITGSDEHALRALSMAITFEQYAFSPGATIKQRPTLRYVLNRSPPKREWPAIEIINLRLPEKKENSDSEGRELTIRFYVKGHFRRQWRPSTKDHKLIWIDEHIRGPEDAPLKPKPTKIYKVTK